MRRERLHEDEVTSATRDPGMNTLDFPASSWRRLGAFALDYVVMTLYIGLLAALMLTLARPLVEAVRTPAQAHLLGFSTLTLPVVLYFALSHNYFGATVGKQMLGLRVVTIEGERLPLGRSLLRAAVKFAPWELAHFAIYRIAGWPQAPEPLAIWQYTAFLLSVGLALGYVFSLFRKRRRPLYDLLSRSRVAELRP